MSELLAPAGSFEALVAAISNGADAIYLGMNRFGARAYASNFDLEELKKAIHYAHLRKVKIYVTMNTIVFDAELPELYEMIDALYLANVDGLIIQDLAVFDYVVQNYPLMEAHCSTQMGIDDLEGTLLLKSLGAKRVVLSREVEIEKIKEIKLKAKIPLEIFVHGALCVSYSGNCLMSGLIGYRSGNRGRCVGSCRKPYEVVDVKNNITYPKSYLLSMKDLNTLNYTKELEIADSLKIEGRMKEPAYVANIVNAYRNALDHTIENPAILQKNLHKTFHRTFTKGYLFHEDKKDITNIEKPNNYGFLIGTVVGKTKIGYKIKLEETLTQGDIIRIDHQGEEINLTALRIYDKDENFIRSSSTTCFLQLKEDLSIGDRVYKTKDVLFYSEIEKTYPKEFKRFPMDAMVIAYAGMPLTIHATCEDVHVDFESDFVLESALRQPTEESTFIKQFDRLTDTVYELGQIDFSLDNVFIPAAKINEARRYLVEAFNEKRVTQRAPVQKSEEKRKFPTFLMTKPTLAVFASTKEQYEAAKACGITTIYSEDHVIRRNNTTYPAKTGTLLVGGYGGIYAYQHKNELVSDFSLNVVNAKAVALLHALGVERVTLSHEINRTEIQELIDSYYQENGGYPNLEMIVYGHADLMYTKYCPLKKLDLCGKCKEGQFELRDEYGSFPIVSHEDCTTTILNGKILNLIDDIESIERVQTFRIQLTTESKEDSIKLIERFKEKLNTLKQTSYFNSQTDTRGHFNKEIL